MLGTAAAGKFLFSGSRQLCESNYRQLSWRGKVVQHIFHWECLATGYRACGGNKTKNLHWSACWWAWPCAQSSSACETRLKAQGPRATGKTSGCLSFLSLKLGWRPRALVTECVALKHMFQLSCVFSLGVVSVLLFTPWNHVYNILLCNWTCIVSFFCYHPFHVSCIVSQLIIKLTVNHFSGLWSGNQSILWSFDTVFIIGIIG